MKKTKQTAGFTMAELLMVVAILVVLFGVAFIGVIRYLKSMSQLEWDTIAKELFVASQNHLTTVESQGYVGLGEDEYGLRDNTVTDKDVYYFIVEDGTPYTGCEKIFDLLLPFGSIDETIRMKGSYLIRYQPSSATVLDAFYSKNGERYGKSLLGYNDGISDLLDNYRENRKNQSDVVGWYGDISATALERGNRLLSPTIQIINAEKLKVVVNDYSFNESYSDRYLKLIIKGESSGKNVVFEILKNNTLQTGDRISPPVSYSQYRSYTVILDDITTKNGLHFCELKDSELWPGENIIIQAVTSTTTTTLTNVARSVEGKTNSLFANLVNKGNDDEPEYSAEIANIRHLENLDYRISNVKMDPSKSIGLNITSAEQTSDLIWKKEGAAGKDGFVDKIGETGFKISPKNDSATTTFYPVSTHFINNDPESPCSIDYNGANHSITGLVVECAGDAGVFGTLDGGSVSNLLVYGGSVTSNNTEGTGNAGGLIGSMAGTVVQKCASTATVKSDSTSGIAGGLIGSASGGTVEACYSASRNVKNIPEGSTNPIRVDYSGAYDVEAVNQAGGLVGNASGTAIKWSYSTCAVKGEAIAGGFVGVLSGVTIDDSYCTGLVCQTGSAGAFAGSITSGEITNCQYYDAVNEVVVGTKFMGNLTSVGSGSQNGITALDDNIGTYNNFVVAPDPSDNTKPWYPAKPYNSGLIKLYGNKYNLKTVKQLGAAVNTTDVVFTHYGDWPAPETLIINTANG